MNIQFINNKDGGWAGNNTPKRKNTYNVLIDGQHVATMRPERHSTAWGVYKVSEEWSWDELFYANADNGNFTECKRWIRENAETIQATNRTSSTVQGFNSPAVA